MPDLQIVRDFPVEAEELFRLVTTPEGLTRWFAHEDATIVDHNLDLGRKGPWHSQMQSREGKRYKLSGQVTHVSPPTSVGFTWAWHDENDRRGEESHVTFTVAPHSGGARLTVNHRDLPTPDAAEAHGRGWNAILDRLTHLTRK